MNRVPIRAGDALSEEPFQAIRRRLALDFCKWDPQVGDVATLSSFPLLLGTAHWRHLSSLATKLAAELKTAELELLRRPNLHGWLGLSPGILAVLRLAQQAAVTPAAARVLRFDFHWTFAGWRISEVNSDVPGGFCEASEFPALMAVHYPGARPAGNPGEALAGALAASVPAGQSVALLAASGFLEDQQIIAYLAILLRRLGVRSQWTVPEKLRWWNGHASLESRRARGPLGAIVRFFQAEWLDVRSCASLFVGGRTPVCNPGIAVLTESKRFPLVWDQLSAPMPTWRELLPQTVDPNDADWFRDDGWLLKSALCNTGDTVAIRSLLTDEQWRGTTKAVRSNPGEWVAQRRFETCPLHSPVGIIYPCIGIYTVDGCPAGIYGRFSRNPVIDFAAVDVAVLIVDS